MVEAEKTFTGWVSMNTVRQVTDNSYMELADAGLISINGSVGRAVQIVVTDHGREFIKYIELLEHLGVKT